MNTDRNNNSGSGGGGGSSYSFRSPDAKQRLEEFNRHFDEIKSKFPSATRNMFEPSSYFQSTAAPSTQSQYHPPPPSHQTAVSKKNKHSKLFSFLFVF